MPPPSLSVIIPAYNEAEEIPTIVPAVLDVLRARPGEWELIVVDNASEDDTAARMAPFLQADPRVRLIRNERNRGKGYSVRRGMLAATGDLRLMCDADCTKSLVSLPALEALTAQAEIVAGARNAESSQVERYQPLQRRAASLAFIFLCRRIMGEPLRDVFCGFKLFTAAAARDVFSRARIDGWAFDAEALALARALGYRVVPCGIVWTHRPGSRLSIPRIMIPVLRELIATRARLKSAVAQPGRAQVEELASAPGPRR
ncbi:MAG TPA: glycosyltransferase [Solirubrobacteraceae bacterium]|nr:glycosyltransferase [Solirubrobacteraceae bacterium]